jgi:FkbM family methyltransferase
MVCMQEKEIQADRRKVAPMSSVRHQIKFVLEQVGLNKLPIYFSRRSYSQEGEDIILADIFASRKVGFYVDVGAHHPFRFSNTFALYKRGWRGINIDPLPGTMKKFKKHRPRDINLELGIADKPGNLTYYMFDEPALNGFDPELSYTRSETTKYKIVEERPIPVSPLRDVLKTHVPPEQKIDLMSIDVEGLDLTVLASNDWEAFSPTIVIAELRQESIEESIQDPIYMFLKNRNYTMFACTGRSCFFRLNA